MKFLLFPVLIITTFIACSNKSLTNTTQTIQSDSVKVITVLPPQQFKQQMEKKQGILIDVRTPGEYNKGHLEGARLLDIFNDNFDAELAKLDKNQTYYVYCAMGGRSGEASEKMEKMGFKHIVDLDGGYTAWKKAGY